MLNLWRREIKRKCLRGGGTAAILALFITPVVSQVPQAVEKGSDSTSAGTKNQDSTAGQAGVNDSKKEQEEPLYREYKGVRLGMSAGDVRQKFGKPKESDNAMDFFIFSNEERARVYYGRDKKVRALIVTYLGKGSGAPAPAAVLGSEIEKKNDGSMYKMVVYPKAGYWVAYSRTPGDSPLTMITMQKIQ